MIGCDIGTLFRLVVAGGSYQEGLTVHLQGVPPGILLSEEEIYRDPRIRDGSVIVCSQKKWGALSRLPDPSVSNRDLVRVNRQRADGDPYVTGHASPAH